MLNIDPIINGLPLYGVLLLLGALALAVLVSGKKGAILRVLSYCLIAILFLNPHIIDAETKTEPNTVIVLKDISASNMINHHNKNLNRTDITNHLNDQIAEALGALNTNKQKLIVKNAVINSKNQQTNIADIWLETLGDTNLKTMAGTIIISDGNIHDVDLLPALIRQAGPVHMVMTGTHNEYDRRIDIIEASPYGVVGQTVDLKFKVLGDNSDPSQTITNIDIINNQDIIMSLPVIIGEEITVTLDIDRGGKNIFILKTPVIDTELTAINNTAIVTVQGVRDRLKVLLVSGVPHNGGRVWRNLLKSDPNIDLVHFTILRSIDNDDSIPANQLALIPFPMKELFLDKIHEFDLIIFDRFSRFGLVPPAYINNIATYIEKGGAFLDVIGPDQQTPPFFKNDLDRLMPATSGLDMRQKGNVGFTPIITDEGLRHPITRELIDQQSTWAPWYRQIEARQRSGTTLMTGINDTSLLLIDKIDSKNDEGRIAQLASDQIWLWARDYQDMRSQRAGGPYLSFMRRLSHWLMKEPDLEETRVIATTPQSSDENTGLLSLDVYAPFKGTKEIMIAPLYLTKDTSTRSQTQVIAIDFDQTGYGAQTLKDLPFGLYNVTVNDQNFPISHGFMSGKEFEKLVATNIPTTDLIAHTYGGTYWLDDNVRTIKDITTPAIKMRPGNIRSARSNGFSGKNWIGLRDNNHETRLVEKRTALLPPLFGFLLLTGLFIVGWRQEST